MKVNLKGLQVKISKKIIILILLIISFIYFFKPSVISSPIYYDIPSEKFDTIKEKAINGDCNAFFNLDRYYNDLYKHKEEGCIILNELLKCDKRNIYYPKMFKANKCKKIVNLNEYNLSQLKQRSLFEYIWVKIKYF